eukprot:COSAG02_NODE_2296_length_9197_cov_11.568587_5_plen_157_part_00
MAPAASIKDVRPPHPSDWNAPVTATLRSASGTLIVYTTTDSRVLTGADLTTVMREIPFSAIQFPLYEGAKRKWGEWQGRPVNTLQASLCGSVCGGFAAAVTTPLDVTKTRLMLGADSKGVPYNVSKHPLTPYQPPACSCNLGQVSDTSHNETPFLS